MNQQDDDIVISGIAGRYPECDSFEEFKEALLSGLDMLTEDSRRWEPGTWGVPSKSGKINNVECFDAGYFGVIPRQANVMDPRHRVMFETVFEAIVDSGYNPRELRGTKTGVYVAIGQLDNSHAYHELENTYGYSLIGTWLGQIANRTSYCFDFRGPSFVLDTACSSGFYALANAVKAMENGDIDSAVVSAVNINFHPHAAKEFNLLNMLAADGKCKVFATDRDGYGRSEAVVTILLQKRSQCRRLYSTVMGIDLSNDGWKAEGITFPSSRAQLELIRTLYKNKNLNPDDVTYIEMHGTGTPAGDLMECTSISEFFCKNRDTPLPIGTVKTNVGHSEISAGLCSITKVLVAMETGIIPANLHWEKLDYSLPGISDGTLKVVTENLPWNGGMVSLNCFGFGGTNAHLVLKSNDRQKLPAKKVDHRLVNVSGRTEECVKYYLDGVKKYQEDQEFLALVDEIHKMDVEGHPYRGYIVLGDNPTLNIKKIPRENRPVWFIYSGMGSQWTGMGRDLMKIDIFRNTIRKCANALKPYNVDLEYILTSDDPKIFQDISNCFAAITATEIALTDVIKAFGIEPDGFAGHSLGEVGCAYCNGELTPEQAMLLGFARGYATIRSKSPPGRMAAVGLSKQEISKWLPENVFIACVNGSNSVTITGLQESVEQFVAALTEKGIFARLVETAGYAFHSKYIDDAVPYLHDFVAKVLSNPQPRSSKWISSSRDESEWGSPKSQLNSAEYHQNNYRNTVLFDQVLRHIPKNAILIEIAPHGLLTSILKREMGPDATCLSLANKNSNDNVQFLLSNIGQLFINGGQPNLRQFYKGVSLPVGRGTTNIGSLIKWDHSIKWFTPYFESSKSFGKKVTINTNDEMYSYMKGHNIDGRVLMSATGYLEVVWKVVAAINSKDLEKLPVIFESVKFLRATVLPDDEDVAFYVNIMKQSGYFEIFEGGSVCCSGTIKLPKEISKNFLNPDPPSFTNSSDSKPMVKDDIYKWFHLKRYMYDGLFQGMEVVDVTGTIGKLKWHGHFTSFLDTMLQVSLIPEYSSELLLPTRVQKLVIDPVQHLKELSLNSNEIPVYHDKDLKLIKSGGIEIVNLEVSVAPKRQHIQADPVLESSMFMPYISKNSADANNTELSLRIALQIVNENVGPNRTLNVCESVTKKENSLSKLMKDICKCDPLLNVAFVDSKYPKIDLILCPVGLVDDVPLDSLDNGGFILVFGFERNCANLGLPIVYENSFNGKGAFLFRKINPIGRYTIVGVKNSDFRWLDKLKAALKDEELVYVINEDEECSGILGLVRCLNMEPKDGASVKCILISDCRVKNSLRDSESFKEQLSNQLTMNVLNNGVWGSYRYLPVNSLSSIDVSSACNLIQTIGDLSSFKWVEMPSSYQNVSNRDLVYVFYAALNFKDVMIATGKVVSNSGDLRLTDVEMGLEYSGISKSGKRVMGIGCPSISLQLLADPLFTWEIPQSWSLEEAATVPVVYSTCYYGLIIRGQMQEGESILIHAGAGGIGIAAISIALSMNCTIFTTVGSQEKRDYLLKLFPQLKPENIGNTRNASFEQMIMKNTKGAGVDVVLNSLAADLFQASIRCVARRGRFIEIGKVDLWAGTPVSASLFSKNTSFHGVLLDDLFDNDDSNPTKLEINRLLNEGIKKGVVRPLPRTVFTEDQVEDAYRLLSTGKHKGKVLVKIRDEHSIDRPQRTIKALPRIYFDPDKTYILVGGLGGFGLELTNFLIKRCARKIVLNSRRGLSNGYQYLCMRRWAQLAGVTVKISTDDTSTLEGARSLVAFAEQLGPIGGVFNMALVLKDALFVNQTPETYDAVFKSKTYSGLNLDRVTREKCPKIDHFVVFSSLASGRGNPGQSNYAMGNSALERLCEKRRNDGLPGLAVQYGPVGDVGAVAGSSKYEKSISAMGLDYQTISSCINALETFMFQPYTIGSTFVKAEENASSRSSDKTPVETVAHILGIKNIDLIDKNLPLSDIGLDSLTGAEIKQTLYRNFSIQVAAEDIRDLTFSKLAEMSQSSNADAESEPQDLPMTNGVNGVATFSAILSDEIIVKIINNKSYSNKVYFIPPIEGNIELMVPLAKQLKSNVYGLQFTKSLDSDNMKQYAQYFVKVIKNIQSNGPYILCGYSYGGSLGFEIAVQLEKQNEKVRLFLIDGTPGYVKQILEREFVKGEYSERKSRSSILKAFMRTCAAQIQSEEVEAIFDDSMDWETQLSKAGEFVAKNTSFSAQEACTSADRYLKRVAAGFLYQPTEIFEGEAYLVRSDDTFRDLPNDYGLQKICKNQIKLDILNGNHRQILLADNISRISELINNNMI